MAAAVGLGLHLYALLTHCGCLVVTALVPFACSRLHIDFCLGMAFGYCWVFIRSGKYSSTRPWPWYGVYISICSSDMAMVLLRLWTSNGPFAVTLHGCWRFWRDLMPREGIHQYERPATGSEQRRLGQDLSRMYCPHLWFCAPRGGALSLAA